MQMEDRVRYQSFISDSGRWDGFELRDDDIVISTPPKSGTTWMQMLCALPATQGFWQDPERFFNRDTSGGWREIVGDTDMGRYDARVATLVDDDLAAWLHR